MKTTLSDRVRLTDLEPTAADFGEEFVYGLQRAPRRLPCKFFYDARGSRLFDLICETPEYYPTRTEQSILLRAGREIADFCGPQCRVVEPGSGSSLKTRVLLESLAEPAAYVPIDISRSHLIDAAQRLVAQFADLEVLPVCADFAQEIALPEPEQAVARTVIFFPGSTLGNFERSEAMAFLRRLGGWCVDGDRLLVGIDLQKPVGIVTAAYNDARGVTAAFNLNLLARANRELGANFDLRQFEHQAVYDHGPHRIEMRLVSRCRQTVRVGGEAFAFAAGEAIVTEHSHKYTPDGFADLAECAGWRVCASWTDPRRWFGVFGLEWSS